MRVHNSSALYRISRFHVGANPRRRRLWTRYRAVPAVIGGYVFATSLVLTLGFVVLAEAGRLLHADLRQLLVHAAGVLKNLNH